MIVGTGIDLVELERMKLALERQPRLIFRILTAEERKAMESLSFGRRVEYLAGRFCAKEALAKALGSGVGGRFSWQDVSILNGENGAPRMVWHNTPSSFEEGMQVHLSLSHSRLYVVAQVIVEKR
jgi:holo-[acyl-carrier protein] synthase